MSEIKTKIRTYNDVIDLFGEEKAADMLSEALDWSTIDPKNDKKNIMERKPLLLDPYMTYEGEDYCKHIVAGFLGDRDLDWASGYIDSEKYEQMEKELPRYGGTRFPPALAALSMDIIIPSSYICKMKAEINPKLSDREREHNSLNRTMHIKVADSRRNRLAQDRDKPRNITPRYDDDSHDSQ